jgi:hypothetical protein
LNCSDLDAKLFRLNPPWVEANFYVLTVFFHTRHSISDAAGAHCSTRRDNLRVPRRQSHIQLPLPRAVSRRIYVVGKSGSGFSFNSAEREMRRRFSIERGGASLRDIFSLS